MLIAVYAISLELTLGVVPQQSPLKLSKKWIKVTDYLFKETNIKVIFKTEKSIQKFEQELYAGNYDLSYMNPYHFIIAHKTQKYQAFTRANKNIVGILLAKNKNIDLSPENLTGKTILFPSPNAFAATLLPKLEFKEKLNFDIDKETKVLYVNSHDSVYKGISRDIGLIGGGIIRTFNNFLDSEDKDNLHIVYKTNPYPSHPIAHHPRVSKSDIKKLQQAFLNMPQEIKKILSIQQFKIITSKEYDVIKKLGISK